jgi:trimeric autotransporter adhesin
LLNNRKYIITILIITITFFIMCTPARPEINIKQGSQDIETGSSFDFGTQEVQTTAEIDFTIKNLVEGELELTGVPFVRIEGTNSDSFSVTSEPEATITAGESTTFTIGYTPQSDGSKTTSVYIESNDEDESTYQFSLNGDQGCSILVYPFVVKNLVYV